MKNLILTVVLVLVSGIAMALNLHSDGAGGAWGPAGHYSSDGAGGMWGPDGQHYSSDGNGGVWTPDGRHLSGDGSGGLFGPDKYVDSTHQNELNEMYKQDSGSSKKQITDTPPSRAQIINRAWRKSEGYRRFKMGTISKLESESAEDYNKWVEQKEERAKRSWIKRCKSGLEKDCWVEPVFEQKDKKIIVYERKQDKPKEKDVSWRKTLDNRVIKPADPSPIRKEKKNGVWKFSN